MKNKHETFENFHLAQSRLSLTLL